MGSLNYHGGMVGGFCCDGMLGPDKNSCNGTKICAFSGSNQGYPMCKLMEEQCPSGQHRYAEWAGGFCCNGSVAADGGSCNGSICALDADRAQGHVLCPRAMPLCSPWETRYGRIGCGLLPHRFPNDPEIMLWRPMILTVAGRDDDGAKAFRAFTEKYPNMATPWLALAYIHRRRDELELAHEALEKCRAIEADAIDCSWFDAKIDAYAGRCKDMEAVVTHWRHLKPVNVNAVSMLAQAQRSSYVARSSELLVSWPDGTITVCPGTCSLGTSARGAR
jgi:hypothetical protein